MLRPMSAQSQILELFERWELELERNPSLSFERSKPVLFFAVASCERAALRSRGISLRSFAKPLTRSR
jgi:hypothetical protein